MCPRVGGCFLKIPVLQTFHLTFTARQVAKGAKNRNQTICFLCTPGGRCGRQHQGPVHLCLNFALLEHYREERRLVSASEHPLCARCFLLPRGGGEASKVRLQEEKLTSPGSPWGLEVKWPFCPTFVPGTQPLPLCSQPPGRQSQAPRWKASSRHTSCLTFGSL